ncbi:zinc metalloproteinase nas-4 isoform X2 [Fundulus heteroclitus]|uniref:zinc metalloproteinase nas-4 isoform X2 n=1 Tax=Fundulus heteroclitus TaxID=8078 RepID=UPI00165B96B5|nr:zinc metalloproteinase nas-4 isoform X2 [Fundulus heteroclitus]
MLLLLLLVVMSAELVKNVPLVNVSTLQNVTHHPETLEERYSDQRAFMEGDMLLLKDRNAVGQSWTTTDLPYVISPQINHRTDDIIAAMAMVSEHTCITFHKRNSESNYVLFKIGNGCASHVGFIGGEQHVYVAPSCSVGNIAHEILHTLGFQHEHTRLDRDKFIDIVQSNIIPGMEKNFKKLAGQTFDIPYDYTSIMHYGRCFFSSNGEPTIIPKKNVKDMGQRDRLMETDIKKIKLLYNCDSLNSNATMES